MKSPMEVNNHGRCMVLLQISQVYKMVGFIFGTCWPRYNCDGSMVADNDAGGITTYAATGAKFGFNLIWLLVLLGPVAYVVQEMTVRLGAVTKRGHKGKQRDSHKEPFEEMLPHQGKILILNPAIPASAP